jgi:hypothetical protein
MPGYGWLPQVIPIYGRGSEFDPRQEAIKVQPVPPRPAGQRPSAVQVRCSLQVSRLGCEKCGLQDSRWHGARGLRDCQQTIEACVQLYGPQPLCCKLWNCAAYTSKDAGLIMYCQCALVMPVYTLEHSSLLLLMRCVCFVLLATCCCARRLVQQVPTSRECCQHCLASSWDQVRPAGAAVAAAGWWVGCIVLKAKAVCREVEVVTGHMAAADSAVQCTSA